MRVTKVSLLGLLCLIVTTTASAQAGIPWVYNLVEAQQMAQRDQRLLLLHFYADWCGPCRMLEQSVFPDPSVGRSLAAHYIPVKIDVDENEALARRYGISQIPADVIIDSQGQVLSQTGSPSNPMQYVQLLDSLAAVNATAAPVQAVSTRVPSRETPPTQTAWDSPWLGQAQGTAAAQGARPTGVESRGTTAWQDRPGEAAAAMIQAEQAARQNTWEPSGQPAPMGNAAYGASGGQGAMSAAPPSPNAGPRASTDYTLNPYANAPLINSASRAPAQASPDNSRGTWGQPPVPTNHSPQSPSSGFAQRPSVPPSPAGNTFENPYAQPQMNAPLAGAANPSVSNALPLALDGFCPVTLAEEEKWGKGDPAWGALHRGRTYLFKGLEQQQRFLADPDRFSPVLSGYDPTRYVDNGQAVAGLRQHGMWFRGKIYLFTDEASLDQFSRNPEHYAQRAHEIMMTAGR